MEDDVLWGRCDKLSTELMVAGTNDLTDGHTLRQSQPVWIGFQGRLILILLFNQETPRVRFTDIFRDLLTNFNICEYGIVVEFRC